MKNHRNLKVVTLKFAAPGHSSVQEVDNMHSFIEKILKNSEFYSIESLMTNKKCKP
jgi:hypothetical protein